MRGGVGFSKHAQTICKAVEKSEPACLDYGIPGGMAAEL